MEINLTGAIMNFTDYQAKSRATASIPPSGMG